jgi:hypothetical protein
MTTARRSPVTAVLALTAIVGSAPLASAQAVNDLPNPYTTHQGHFTLPDGRTWGSTSAVDIDIDGTSIWVGERCGTNSCAGSDLDSVLKFDADGNLVTSFGAGTLIFPHGIHIDTDGNVWITDAQGPNDDAPELGHRVIKFSPTGEVLLVLGEAGVAGDGTDQLLNTPCDVITAPDGSIFVADGHGGQGANAPPDTVARIVKYDAEGNYLMHWGGLGSEPGQFRTPHGLAWDSRGRLFVADRGNVRIQIFDQEGNFQEEWPQFSRLSGIFITADDTLYGADSESSDTTNPGWRRGIRVGSAATGEVMHFIPDPALVPRGTSAAEGVAVDANGNIYGAEVGPRQLVRYTR